MNLLLILLGKVTSFCLCSLNLGNGSTWPGHIALKVNKNFVRDVLHNSKMKIIIVAGTNGKTTTTKMISTILEGSGKTVIQNHSGANLLNGIASSLLLHSSILSTNNYDYAVFEVDENALPLMLKEITPDYLLLLNLFRDQLDRYGEVDSIAKKWKNALKNLSEKTTLILNADDPEIAYLGVDTKAETLYFGLNHEESKSQHEHAVDSVYCPRCGMKLDYKKIFYSHLGEWKCKSCKLSRPNLSISNYPTFPLFGMYNQYNTLAAVLLARTVKIDDNDIKMSLKNFSPAFGRQEKIVLNNKIVQLFLVKNPTGFNESLRTITLLGARSILIVLNDRIADGRDVSWIWDVDIEEFIDIFDNIIFSGDRAHDMGLRLKYAQKEFHPTVGGSKFQIEKNLNNAINSALDLTPKKETLYILPTYTAMLETRKILTGKKIL